MSIRANDLYHTDVVTPRGKRIGRVSDVLFDAEKPVVVGYVVERPRLLYLFDRKDRYLAADKASASRDAVAVSDPTEAWDSAAARRLGLDWAETVIWSGMTVRTASGAEVGTVKDVLFEPDGTVSSLVISAGAAVDVAIGTRQIEAPEIQGYRDGAVVVSEQSESLQTSGGAAAAAGRGAAVAGEQMRQTAQAAGKALKTAATYGKAAAKVAARSDTGKKTIKWLRSVRDEIIDAMGDAEDD